MSLPTSRNTTYAAGSQVKSADLNDLQDHVIAHESEFRGTRTIFIPAVAGMMLNPTAWAIASGMIYLQACASAAIGIQIPVKQGDRIVSWNLHGYTAGATAFTAVLKIATMLGSTVSSSSTSSDSVAGYKASGKFGENATIGGSQCAYIYGEFPTVGDRCIGATVWIDNP